MISISQNLEKIQKSITRVLKTTNRAANHVTILAVSKTFSSDAIRTAYGFGQRHFGENYFQEAKEKIEQLSDLRACLFWHFIGPVQSNKTRFIAEQFDWVHSIDRFKIAQRLSEQRPKNLLPLNICIQININEEKSKHGIFPDESVFELAKKIICLPHIKLRGLMTIPAITDNKAQQKKSYHQMQHIFNQLNRDGFGLDTLSMGMSNDYEIAIEEGATIVRIGTALFGKRQKT